MSFDVGLWVWGKERSRREPDSRQSSSALGGQTQEDCTRFPRGPGGRLLCEVTDPTRRVVDKGQSWHRVPSLQRPTQDTAEELRTEWGPWGRTEPQGRREEGAGLEGT